MGQRVSVLAVPARGETEMSDCKQQNCSVQCGIGAHVARVSGAAAREAWVSAAGLGGVRIVHNSMYSHWRTSTCSAREGRDVRSAMLWAFVPMLCLCAGHQCGHVCRCVCGVCTCCVHRTSGNTASASPHTKPGVVERRQRTPLLGCCI